jgi:hypothetical protein
LSGGNILAENDRDWVTEENSKERFRQRDPCAKTSRQVEA